MSDVVKVAKSIIISILSNNDNPTVDGMYEIFQIRSGNKEILIEHIKAIRNIMDKALKELEGSDSNDTN